jgi:hypothetical protein
MLYSEALKKNLPNANKQVKELPSKEYVAKRIEKLEKELYSKECVAESIKFFIERDRENIGKNEMDKFSCNLATILAKDHEQVAVWLKSTADGFIVYLSKNFAWCENDLKYISRIVAHLKDISKNAPKISEDTEIALFNDIFNYCSTKFEYRLKKLKYYIQWCQEDYDVFSFMRYTKIDADNIDTLKKSKISELCNMYYKEGIFKEDPMFHEGFLKQSRKWDLMLSLRKEL